jgi:hypothetical protein
MVVRKGTESMKILRKGTKRYGKLRKGTESAKSYGKFNVFQRKPLFFKYLTKTDFFHVFYVMPARCCTVIDITGCTVLYITVHTVRVEEGRKHGDFTMNSGEPR